MKGHVSYERAPLRGYIYSPHFSFVIISFIFLFYYYSYIYYYPKWISSYSKYFGYFVYELSWFTTHCKSKDASQSFVGRVEDCVYGLLDLLVNHDQSF
jgi:hypothetical protein